MTEVENQMLAAIREACNVLALTDETKRIVEKNEKMLTLLANLE